MAIPLISLIFRQREPDDRYPDMAGYVAAKTRLLDGIRPGGTAVIGVDDDYSRTVFAIGPTWSRLEAKATMP